ncbi:hypothetical protein ACFL4Z_03010 [candidate division KSB1 bacterium]
MDLTKSKELQSEISKLSKMGDLSLYKEADERSMTILDLLEERDPSERDSLGNIVSPIDAFERQLMLANITSDENRSVMVEDFFSSSAMILAPEWFRRQIKAGMDMKPGADRLIAAEAPVKGPSYKPLYIASPETKGKSLSEIADGSAVPKVTVTYRDKDVSICDYGRGIDFTYRVIRWSSLAEFKVILWYIGFNIQNDKIGSVYNAVISGDGSSGEADSVSANSVGYTNLTYDDLVNLFVEFEPFEMNAIIINKNVESKLLSMPEFKDPHAGFKFQKTGEIVTPMGAEIFRYDSASDNYIAAIDKRFAIKKGVEQDLLVEADKIIERRIEECVISESIAYSVLCDNARKYLDMS